MSFLPGSTHTPRGRRDAGQPANTEALPTADPSAHQEWTTGTAEADDVGTGSAFAATAFDDGQSSFQVEPLPAPAEEEPFVPKSRYVMGRSTKVMACILMVAAGVFAGSAIQKQVDAGTRGARSNFANFQGSGAGGGAGAQPSGQGRRNGGSGAAGAGNGSSGAPGAGTAGAGTGATAAPTAGTP